MVNINQPACPVCKTPMEPVSLCDVPAEKINSFLGNSGNKLEDDWYWCSECDTYDQRVTPELLSPEAERLNKMIEYYSSF